MIVGRPMPLKKPSTAHMATPSGPPSMRGCQNDSASCSVAGAMPKGPKMRGPLTASTANSGTVNNDAHSAVQVACDARA